MLKFQKYSFSLAHVYEMNLVPGCRLGIALETEEKEYGKDDG
jgi:hypothetical protein